MVQAGVFFNQSIFLLVILLIILMIKKHNLLNLSKCLFLLWSCYFILHFTVFDYPIGGKIATYMFEDYQSIQELFQYYNFIPFHSICEYATSGLHTFVRQVCGNIILFVPFGIAISWIFEKNSFRHRIYFIVTTSLLIEIVQLFLDLCSGMVVKYIDVDDILLNSIGGLIGICIFTFVNWLISKLLSHNFKSIQ